MAIHQNLNDTIVALATPQGVGAIGVIRLSGKGSIPIADHLFFGKSVAKAESHTILFGTIRDDQRIVDEVLVSVFKDPHSYTGEDSIEISCHGSSYILQEVISLCLKHGARLAGPGEFTMRAFLNGKLDLAQAEAVADLIASESSSAHEMAMKQMRGGFSSEITQLREEFIHFASLIELELDFSEEDVEFADRTQLKELLSKIDTVLAQLMQSFALGNAIKNGVPTVIVGKPNAGKSTLLNALLKEERAIVSAIAGTTRDTIEEQLNIDGIPFRFIDTAGLRDAKDEIESIGVERSFEKMEQADIIIYLFDCSTTSPTDLVKEVAQLKVDHSELILVGNKVELNEEVKSQFIEVCKENTLDQPYFISALNKEGIDLLRERLKSQILSRGTSSTIVSNARHFEALRQSQNSLIEVRSGLDNGIQSDLLAVDIRRALHFLGEITGEVSTDDLLGNIFSNFCIGK